LAQVMISGSRDGAPGWTLRSVQSPLEILSLCPLLQLKLAGSLSQINKIPKQIKIKSMRLNLQTMCLTSLGHRTTH